MRLLLPVAALLTIPLASASNALPLLHRLLIEGGITAHPEAFATSPSAALMLSVGLLMLTHAGRPRVQPQTSIPNA